MSAGSCWSQQNSMDVSDSRRPSEDVQGMPISHHHLHAIFKDHQIMSPIKEISTTYSPNQQQNVTDQMVVEEGNTDTNNLQTVEITGNVDFSANINGSGTSSSSDFTHPSAKDNEESIMERPSSSASVIAMANTNELEERRSSLSLVINYNKQIICQGNSASPQKYPSTRGQRSGKSKTRPSSPRKYPKYQDKGDSLSKLNKMAPLSSQQFSQTRYRTPINIIRKNPTSNVPQSGTMIGAASKRNIWRKSRPMSLDTLLKTKDGNKTIMDAPLTSGNVSNEQR